MGKEKDLAGNPISYADSFMHQQKPGTVGTKPHTVDHSKIIEEYATASAKEHPLEGDP